MRKTTIKTSVTITGVNAILFEDSTNTLINWNDNIPATAKTEKGLEKLVSDYIPENTKLVKIVSSHKYQIWYEMDRETFMRYASEIEK